MDDNEYDYSNYDYGDGGNYDSAANLGSLNWDTSNLNPNFTNLDPSFAAGMNNGDGSNWSNMDLGYDDQNSFDNGSMSDLLGGNDSGSSSGSDTGSSNLLSTGDNWTRDTSALIRDPEKLIGVADQVDQLAAAHGLTTTTSDAGPGRAVDAQENSFDDGSMSDVLSHGAGNEFGVLDQSMLDSADNGAADPNLYVLGRGQVGVEGGTGTAQGLRGEGFADVNDLLGSGTKEEISRYTPGSVDYGLRSGTSNPGEGLQLDSTMGANLTSMGGGQGLTIYNPAEYPTSYLEDLVNNHPGEYPDIEDYLRNNVYNQPAYRGTGGTETSLGFLQDNSARRPLGSTYSLGDPNSYINNPRVTGNQSVVTNDRVVSTNNNGTLTTATADPNGKVTRTTTPAGTNPPAAPAPSPAPAPGKTPAPSPSPTPAPKAADAANPWAKMLPLLLMMLAMNKMKGASGPSYAKMPDYKLNRSQTNYAQQMQAPGYRPGQGGISYFNPVQYVPKLAHGGSVMSGIASVLNHGGLLHGRGDGVSDSIPARIDHGTHQQPARLARGEYVVDARTVAALGNGSTDAGAERLDEMRKRILASDRRAAIGQDSQAYKHLKV